jgi:N-acetylmuramoyl-L-alanine amidase
MQMMSKVGALLLVAAVFGGPGAPEATAQSARTLYTRALARERTLRDEASKPQLRELRRAIASYESIVRRFPASAYCDNALWQGANLAVLAYERYGDAIDARRGLRLLDQLKKGYPSSSLRGRIDEVAAQLQMPPPPRHNAAVVNAVATRSVDDAAVGVATIREIRRAPLPGGVRVTIEMDAESLFTQDRLENPSRLFFDLKRARASATLQDATLRFNDGAVRQIRLGRRGANTTRVVLDISDVQSYSVFTLYNPFRLIVDLKAGSTAAPAVAATAGTAAVAPAVATREVAPTPVRLDPEPPVTPDRNVAAPAPAPSAPVERLPVADVPAIPPPSVNMNGGFSLARQLGLGVSRIVIDAGHGGHDPGARAHGLNEADLVLDVANRLRKLLDKQPGMQVTMTRDTDVFIPLEQRTAIANREGADLFLSIHANASRNSRARGVETYFLNFASNPEAEAVAARENSTSGQTMHKLPDIVRAIALNNKLDESRDFADMVQKSMVRRLGAKNGQLRDLGVKQAPFVVLIGAGMPSVLAEISFLTNRQEAQLLKTGQYRQQIAEALFDAVLRYQGSLKKMRSVAARE